MLNEKDQTKLLLDLQAVLGSIETTWFIAFGTLLWLVRDKPQNKPLNTDIDIGVFYGDHENIEQKMLEHGYVLQKKIIDDIHEKPLQMVFKHREQIRIPDEPCLSGVNVDIFFFFKHEGLYWHNVDFKGENPKDGIPSEYYLKSMQPHIEDLVPIRWIDGQVFVRIPSNLGSCLDDWYPVLKDTDGKNIPNTSWLNPLPNYGMSKSERILTLKTLEGIL